MNHEDTDMFSHLNDLKSRRSMWLKAPKTCRGVLAPRTCRGVLAPKTCRGVLWLKAGNSLKRKHLKHALNGCIADKNTCCNSFKEEQRVTGNPRHVSTRKGGQLSNIKLKQVSNLFVALPTC